MDKIVVKILNLEILTFSVKFSIKREKNISQVFLITRNV